MRTFSQSEPTRLLSSLQGASISQQHRLRCHRIQGPYHQYPQVPTVSLVPCPTLLNTVPTQFTHDETQRFATKPDFHQQKKRKKGKEKKKKKNRKMFFFFSFFFFFFLFLFFPFLFFLKKMKKIKNQLIKLMKLF